MGATREIRDQDPDDLALLLQIEMGNAQALAQLYDRHAGLVYSVAIRVCGRPADAEDVLQEIFFQIWQRPHQFVATRGNLTSWLGVVARNRSIDLIRSRHASRQTEELSPELPAEGCVGESVVAQLMSHRAHELIERLPSEQRRLLDLAFFGGRTHKEIAAETGLPLGTIKTRIRTALRILRDQL